MILILSGPSGSGKSAACAVLYDRSSASGVGVGGVRCAAVFKDGIKTGIDAVLLGKTILGKTMPVMPLARLRAGFDPAAMRGRPGADPTMRRVPVFDTANPSRFSYGIWDFDAAVLGKVDASVAACLRQALPITIVDEIGPLEIDHGIGFMKTLAVLDAIAAGSGTAGTACIVTSRPDVAIALKGRWPAAAVMESQAAGGFDVELILEAITEAG
jgi:hypothetical protein